MAKKILIVEDESWLGEVYKEKLEREGFEVILAETAEEGFEIAKKEKPDLVLLDILLPYESGVDFLKKLKKDPEISQTKVLAFSNYDEPKTKNEVLSLGVLEYVMKTDFTPDEFVEKIKTYLKE